MTELLDSTVKKKTVQDGFSNIQDRIRHLFIDGLIVLIVAALIRTVLEYMHVYHSNGPYYPITVSIQLTVYFFYYTIMEYHFKFTVGKLLNKTRVIGLNNQKPTIVNIIVRAITRLIPVGFILIVTPYKAFLHDVFSKTRTVRIKKKKVVHVNEI